MEPCPLVVGKTVAPTCCDSGNCGGGLIEATFGTDTEALRELLNDPDRPLAPSFGPLRATTSGLARGAIHKLVFICYRCGDSWRPAASRDDR